MNQTKETEDDAQRMFERTGVVITALDKIVSQAWQELDVKNIQWVARQEVAQECQRHALAVVDLAYPARQTSAFTPLSLMHGTWMPEEEPEPPALERWVAGYLTCRVCIVMWLLTSIQEPCVSQLSICRFCLQSQQQRQAVDFTPAHRPRTSMPAPKVTPPHSRGPSPSMKIDNSVLPSCPQLELRAAPSRFNTVQPHKNDDMLREELAVWKQQVSAEQALPS